MSTEIINFKNIEEMVLGCLQKAKPNFIFPSLKEFISNLVMISDKYLIVRIPCKLSRFELLRFKRNINKYSGKTIRFLDYDHDLQRIILGLSN